MKDTFDRKIDYLRISVTDRCNLRCKYCMPELGIKSLSHNDILTYEEILRIVRCFAQLGVSRIKITGGEPLVRLNVTDLIGELKKLNGIEQVTLTTNGTHLTDFIDKLHEKQIDGINISLDTLNPELYEKITGRDSLNQVINGLKKVLEYPDIKVKVNCVPMGIPEQNITGLAGLAKTDNVHIRFIEMMPIGLGRSFTFKSEADIIKEIEQTYGPLVPCNEDLGNGPAHYFSISGFKGKIGFISAMSHKFCNYCNRVRLTADGRLKTCLQYDVGVSLREVIRNGASDEELEAVILKTLQNKPQEHHFTDEYVADRETKSMFQIGG